MMESFFLRKLQDSDLYTRVAWMNDVAVYSSMSYTVPVTLENTQKWFLSNSNKTDRFDCVLINQNDELLAMAGLTNIDETCKKAELYIFVDPKRQHQGLGWRATYLLCKYGFHVLHLNKIYLCTNASNIGAQKTYQKVGFQLEGCHRAEKISNGKYEDRLYYGLLAGEFNNQVMPLVVVGNKHLLLEKNKGLSKEGANIMFVRDDLFPFVGGGSKARKAVAYECFLKENGYNAVVTCGGIQSNHNRAMALMCARNGWKCHLCVQGSEERFLQEKGNALLVRMSGADYECINPNDTSQAMNSAINKLTTEGWKPFYVVGGGHNLPGGTCFVDAVIELKRQCDLISYKPDYIFLASGTGSTQAGIIVGLDIVGWHDVKCIGISVARQKERGKQVIADFATKLAEYYGIQKDYTDSVLFNTDYLFGGYEKYTAEMEEYLLAATKKTGIAFDTTYSGKGFYGMMQEIEKQQLYGKNIIFWHTGGLMNLMK